MSSDKCVYEGSWASGKPHGSGKLTWPSGATYTGNFVNGVPDGPGNFLGAKGDYYSGHWLSGSMHGTGMFKWRDGSVYQGNWLDGLFSGTGVFSWANRITYEGYWENGAPSGEGRFTWPDQKSHTVDWDEVESGRSSESNNGSRILFTWASGLSYAGYCDENGVPCGKGTFTRPDGKKHVVNWEVIMVTRRLAATVVDVDVGTITVVDKSAVMGVVNYNQGPGAGGLNYNHGPGAGAINSGERSGSINIDYAVTIYCEKLYLLSPYLSRGTQ